MSKTKMDILIKSFMVIFVRALFRQTWRSTHDGLYLGSGLLRGRFKVSIRFDSKLVHNLIRRSGTRCKCQFSDIISICNRKPVKRPIFGHFYFEQKSLYLYFLLCSGSGRILHDTFFGQKFVKILEIVIFMTKNMVFWS